MEDFVEPIKDSNIKPKKKIKLNRIQILILYFFIFSFVGWLLETLYAFHNFGYFVKRGFLYGPLCPIYGYGALILILFFSKYRKDNIKLFVYASIVFSAFEYVVSYALEAMFSMHWWDYTNEVLNLNGRISIFYSFAWGIAAILFINHIYPFFKKKINLLLSKVPYKIQVVLLYITIAVFVVDTAMSSVRYLN